jgi:hypothetical protein
LPVCSYAVLVAAKKQGPVGWIDGTQLKYTNSLPISKSDQTRNVLLTGWNSIWLQFSNKTTSYTSSKQTYCIVFWSIFTCYQHTRYSNIGLSDCICSHQMNSTFY